MKNPDTIKKMFNTISKKYDFMNKIISLGLHNKVKKESIKLLDIKNTDKILDVCTGTGDLAIYMSNFNPNAEIIGIDFSENMLEIAQRKNKNINIKFKNADCTNLPFEDNSFDIVTSGFGLRNIENYEKAILEIKRVLKPDGTFLHLDFSCNNCFSNKLFDLIIPFLVKLFYADNMPYKYLVSSKKDFLDTEKLTDIFKKFDFTLSEKRFFVIKALSALKFRNNKN